MEKESNNITYYNNKQNDIYRIKQCYEIANCNLNTRLGCSNFINKTSCWLSFNQCSCKLEDDAVCNTCYIYSQHQKELIMLRSQKFNPLLINSYLRYLDPIFEGLINGSNSNQMKSKREKRILQYIALQILGNEEIFNCCPMEKYLCKIYEEILR